MRSVQGGRLSHSGSRGREGDASPCSRLSTWDGMQSPVKLPRGPMFTPAGFGISLSLWEPFRSDVQMTSSKHE